MNIRYYCTELKTEVSEPSATTIDNTNEEIAFFFEALPEGKWLRFTEAGMPYLIDSVPENQTKD